MAEHNAKNELKNLTAARSADLDLLLRLQKKLKTSSLPKRIECFDNSNISGTEPVAAMVVFENARAKKTMYRKYRIKTVTEHDDYAYMREVLERRFGKGAASKPFPDLLMVDGGKGQLNIALAVIKELNLEGKFDLIGIAKKDETKGEMRDKIFKPARFNPLGFGREGDLLLFLQRIRDEAHRFAITYHRKRRQKRSLQSALDSIPGVGKKRKTILLQHFKSIKNIRAAGLEEIRALPGFNRNLAESVQKALSR
jgi:excinuclease ABC subunit C